jgi:hypothetical protein
MRRDGGYRVVRCIGEDHQAIRHWEAGLFQAGTVESLASNTRQIGSTESIEGSKKLSQRGHDKTLLHCYIRMTLKMQS